MAYAFYLILAAAGLVIYLQQKKILGLRQKLNMTARQRKDLFSENEQLKKAIQRRVERHDFKIKLISMLTHDFRGAFMNIISLMDFYKKGEIPSESFSPLFEELKSTSKNNLHAFESTLTWVKTQLEGYKFRPELLIVSHAIEKAVKNNSSEIKRKGISLSVKGDKEAKMLADDQLMGFVLKSVINNAVKFSHPGGVIDCVIGEDENNMIKVHITDFGIGMDDKTLSSVFSHDKTIYTGTIGEKGTGISLLICRDFVEIQNGSITAVSEEGVGSVFTLSIPSFLQEIS